MSSLVSSFFNNNNNNNAVVCLDYDGCTDILFEHGGMNSYFELQEYDMAAKQSGNPTDYAGKLGLARKKLIAWLANIADTHDKVYITCGSNRQSAYIDKFLGDQKSRQPSNKLRLTSDKYYAFENLENLAERLKTKRIENVAYDLINDKEFNWSEEELKRLNIEPVSNKAQNWELVKLLLPDAGYKPPVDSSKIVLERNKLWRNVLEAKNQLVAIQRRLKRQEAALKRTTADGAKSMIMDSMEKHRNQISRLSDYIKDREDKSMITSMLGTDNPVVGNNWASTFEGDNMQRLAKEEMHWKVDIVLNNLNYFKDKGVTDFYFIDDDTHGKHKPLNGFMMAQNIVLKRKKNIHCDVHLCKYDWYAMCDLDDKVQNHHDIEELYYIRRDLAEGETYWFQKEQLDNIKLIF